jgi:hypothetical protein
MFIVSCLALAHIGVFLPPSLPKRGILAALAIIPLLGLLQVYYHVASWTVEGNASEFMQNEHLTGAVHPVLVLAAATRAEVSAMLQRQSTTLPAAVAEYRSHYKRSPPPGFDA